MIGNIDDLPFVGAAYRRPRPAGVVSDLIVLHSAETGEGDTAAEGVAAYFALGRTIGSAHISLDNNSAVRCAHDWERTNGAGGVNANGLHIEQAGRAAQSFVNWSDAYSAAVVENAAEVCRQWIARFPNIKPVYLDAAALRAGRRGGITTHAQVTQAGFAGNDGHWDPGPNYPIERLLSLIGGGAQGDDDDMLSIYILEAGSKQGWILADGVQLTWIDQPMFDFYRAARAFGVKSIEVRVTNATIAETMAERAGKRP